MVVCRLLGHRYRFRADGASMRWECSGGCGVGGEKRYATAAEASRYSRGLERERRVAGEGRVPVVALLPPRLLHRVRRFRPVD